MSPQTTPYFDRPPGPDNSSGAPRLLTLHIPKYCSWCSGFGERRCFVTARNPRGYEKCFHCRGSGYEP